MRGQTGRIVFADWILFWLIYFSPQQQACSLAVKDMLIQHGTSYNKGECTVCVIVVCVRVRAHASDAHSCFESPVLLDSDAMTKVHCACCHFPQSSLRTLIHCSLYRVLSCWKSHYKMRKFGHKGQQQYSHKLWQSNSPWLVLRVPYCVPGKHSPPHYTIRPSTGCVNELIVAVYFKFWPYLHFAEEIKILQARFWSTSVYCM